MPIYISIYVSYWLLVSYDRMDRKMGKNGVFAITRKNGVLVNCVNSIMLIDRRKQCFLVILFELFLSTYPFSVSDSESVSYIGK